MMTRTTTSRSRSSSTTARWSACRLGSAATLALGLLVFPSGARVSAQSRLPVAAAGGASLSPEEPGVQPEAWPVVTLDEVLRKAKSDPPAVLTARAGLQRTAAERSLAKSQWLPALIGQASYGYAYDNRLVLPDTPRINSESLEARGSLSLEWSALDAARSARIDAASASERAAGFSLESTQRRAMLAAAELFFYASAAAELVDDAALSLSRRTQQERATSDLVEAGTRSPVDVQRAHIEVVSAQYMLEERRREQRAASSALAVALGRAPDAPVRPAASSSIEAPAGQSAKQLTQLAQNKRPEVMLASAQLEAARSSHSAVVAERLPTLGAAATGSLSYLDVRRGQGIDGHQYDAAVSVYLRFRGLDPAVWLKGDVQGAIARQAELTRAQVSQQVSAEVVSADHEWHRANIELQRAVAVQEAAQVAREAQNGRYLAGLSSLLELLDAEDLEQKARQRRIEARRDEAVAVVRLLGACGLLGR